MIAAAALAGWALAEPAELAEPDKPSEPDEPQLPELQFLPPDLPVQSVAGTPLKGVFALELANGQVLYAAAEGRYLFAGDLYQVGDEDVVNLTEQRRSKKRLALLDGVAEADMLIFAANGRRKAQVSIFTDVDCGYCRQMHREMAEINALGIEVRYLAFPRAGPGSDAYRKIVSAWCAENPNQALTDLKMGRSIPERSCKNPVADQYQLAARLGVTGTPAIITEEGQLLPGYLPADRLAQALGL